MNREQLQHVLDDGEAFAADAFAALKQIGLEIADLGSDEGRVELRELVIRARAHRDRLGEEGQILDALVRQVGLFPYLPEQGLPVQDLLAREAHRPLEMDELVFHSVQAELYRRLLGGESLIVSAPTSFGKSLIIDALIASGKFTNVVIVVPTIALIDETRVRLGKFRASGFRVITHASQQPGEKNLIVMTQERVLEHPALPDPDLLVVDEFYKLDPAMDPERSALLNQAFYRLLGRSRQFYLLGPHIRGLSQRLPAGILDRFVHTDYATVALDVERINAEKDQRPGELVRICREYDGPTLIYCTAPAGCRRAATELMRAGIGAGRGLPETADWLAEHVHSDWALVAALRQGIGIHHGQMPRWLAQHMVRAFNSCKLDYLICTSTLIEGVNTTAKNVIIYEKRLGNKNLDSFTFNNIRGRSGRMQRHFVGRVFHFDPAPAESLVEVDIPVLSQPEDAPLDMLLELPESERTETTKKRLERALEDQPLPEEVIKLSPGIGVEQQGSLAKELASDPDFYEEDLSWSGMPTTQQLRQVCELIWTHLVPNKSRRHGVASGPQLAARIGALRMNPSARQLILAETARRPAVEFDTVVDDVMEFLRHWQEFEFPKFLRCVDHVQRWVLGRRKLATGDYSGFASQVESFFTTPYLSALDEYGIPLEVAKKLESRLEPPPGLDDLLGQLIRMGLDGLGLTDFERDLVLAARDNM